MKIRHCNIPAAYLALIKDNKILLLRRYNTGHEDGNYSMIAGHVDAGETFTECIIREAEEEAGILLEPKNLKVAHVMHRNANPGEQFERVDVFFTADSWGEEIINKEPHKCDELAWFDIGNLPDKTIPYIRQAIDSVWNGVYYSEYGRDEEC